MKIIYKSGIRYYSKNILQVLLSILGVALGVAVVIAIDLANNSASKAFDISVESVSGKATHQITGGPGGLSDTLLKYVRIELGIEKSAPVIEKFVRLSGDRASTMTLLGLEPFSEKSFRNYLSADFVDFNNLLIPLMTTPRGCVISQKTASKYNLKINDTLKFETDGSTFGLKILGLIEFSNKLDEKAAENLIITDISVAQDMLKLNGYISHIDLILDSGSEKSINSKLPEGVRLNKSVMRSDSGKNMTESFRVNLTAMSLLSLIVGMFLIYNTMTFSVVQRRKLIGLLRSIGITQGEIFKLILSESIIIGIFGTLLGLLGGLFLGKFLIELVTKTINDMYFVLQVQDIHISEFSLIKGLLLGIAATVVSAFKPAKEAASVPAGIALIRSIPESGIKSKAKTFLFVGIILILLGGIFVFIPIKNIYVSYLGVVPFFIGFALITPFGIISIIKILTPLMGKMFGSLGTMASRSITEHLSRTTIAVAALSIAISAAIGIGTMVSSFRQTVVDWLNYRLKADIYASVPTNVSRFNDGTFEQWVVDSVSKMDGVRAMNIYREFQQNYNGRIFHILAMKVQSFKHEKFLDKIADADKVWEMFNNEEVVIVSESFTYKNDTKIGDTLEIPTDKGLKKFPVAAVYYDYSSDIGLIFMHMKFYRKYFNDRLYSGIGVFAENDVNIDELADRINQKISPKLNFIVRTNRSLINSSIEIFDRTFLITNVLQLLAIIVSFIGIFSALMALQLEKARQFAILRANGMTPSQLWKLVFYQTGLMGLISGLFALPLGNILAYILIEIINKRSFGWTIQFYFMPSYLLEGIIVGVISALLAGIYPAYKMSKTPPAIALRDE